MKLGTCITVMAANLALLAASETAIIDFTAPAGPVKDVNGMCNSRIPFRNDSYDTPQRIRLDMRGASPQDFDMYRLDFENRGNFRRIGRLSPDGEFDLPWKGVVFCTTKVK